MCEMKLIIPVRFKFMYVSERNQIVLEINALQR